MKVPWQKIVVGDVVQDKKGLVYEVTGRTGDRTYVLERDKKKYPIRQPTGEVERLLSREAAMETAIALTQVHLGGRVHAVQIGDEEKGVYRVRPNFDHPGELAAHLYVLHSTVAQVDLLPELTALHEELHRPEQKASGYVPHEHDPRFLSYVRRQNAEQSPENAGHQ